MSTAENTGTPVSSCHAHQPVDHRSGDEVVAVDAAVDHERERHDRVEATRARQGQRMQRNLEGAGHVEAFDPSSRHVLAFELGERRFAGTVDDVAVPARRDERDAG